MKFSSDSRYPSDGSDVEIDESEFNDLLKIASDCYEWAVDLTIKM